MAQDVLKGASWEAVKQGATYVVSAKDKTELVSALTDFVEKNGIQTGAITGVGAMNYAKLKFFDPATKKYDDKEFNEQMELVNLTGNISIVDGKPLLHLHATLGRKDYSALAGHLEQGKVRGAGEFYVTVFPQALHKKKNEDIGLNIYDFGPQ